MDQTWTNTKHGSCAEVMSNGVRAGSVDWRHRAVWGH
jgi:hypothetical protein